ncbi:MAG: PLP-dependent aminotransferase family protein [Acidobacteriota bacterium]|nr:PLP-dependent aminotransferase family protein [Acidobacteriota bacterium]
MPHPPFIILDENFKAPLYRQIYETIRRSILSGEFHSGRQLPATRLLAKQLGISRLTVINAYDQLTAEGYLESKSGAGTYVAEHLPEEFLQTPLLKKSAGETEFPPRKFNFSKYGKNVFKESRRVLRYNGATPLVAFQHGLAAIDEFPFDVWAKAVNKCYRAVERQTFGYGEPAGFLPLREAIGAYLKSARAVNCTPEQVIITSGAQQAFDLIGRVFLEPKTKVLIENPCYFGVKQAFQSFDAEFVPVPVDKDGFDLAAVTNKQSHNARLVYVTPSHQFPLGVTMSLPRRLQLLEWARAAEAWIIEDDYDSEFRYEGRPLPSLQGLDRDPGRVLYIGTFSKTIFPALRLGCLVVPRDLIETFTAVRALSGSHSPLIDQATLAEFIAEGHFGRHIRRMRRLYEDRQQILVAEVKKQLADRLEVEKTVSGMHVIGWLPDGVKDSAVVEKAAQLGIRTATVSSLSLTGWQRGGLILGYTAINEKQIKKGVKLLAKAIENLGRK